MNDAHPPAVAVRAGTTEDEEAIAQLAYDYLTWLDARLLDESGLEFPPMSLDEMREEVRHIRRTGVYLVVEIEDRLVGIGAVHRHGEGGAVLKRMYLHPETRGRGIGAVLLDALLHEARGLGASVLWLETMPLLTVAQQLYRSRGFVERDPYPGCEIPPAFLHECLYFERRLEL